jgi:HEAT repeat protein
MMTHARWIAIGLLLSGVGGCAATWDEITSHERDYRYIFNRNKPSPLEVIQKSDDGARRADALGALKEPLRHGGNEEDQNAYLAILGAAAKTDFEPLCRLSAIRALGKFKDPRAARILEEVYQQQTLPARPENRLVIRFNADTNAFIRKEALVALEATGDKEAVHLLVRVARQPGPPVTTDGTDRQQTQDEKAVAIRALKNYPQPEVMDALVHLLRTEKDVGLRHCALESLEKITNKHWPADRDSWQAEDVRPLPGLPADANVIQRVGAWFQK